MAKILLVEDEPDNRDLIRMSLETRGHVVVATTTAEEGLQIARSSKPDLILMDISLPGAMDGLDATRTLRSSGEFAHVPIVAITAHAMRDDRERALDAGCDEYISKPITDLPAFLRDIDRLIARGVEA